ncbi:MAG: carotenoid biosynthesis protein, partial [Bacteroidota bacterium]
MSHPDALSRWSVVALWLLGIFTAVAVVGYATFGLNPGLLARFPATVSFYAISFSFFAQAHVLLGAVVLIFYLTRQVRTKWLAAFVAVYVLSLASELGGTSYGIPFGHYDYTGLLGAMWLDRVPWLIPVSWFAMAVPSYALAVAAFPGRSPALRIAFASYLLVAWDLALDPAMSYLTSYWLWEDAGLYYGMPAVNLVGWAVTAIVIMGVMYALGAESWLRQVSARWMAAYYLLIVAMPFGMILFAGLWWAVAATVASLALAWFVASREKDRNVTAAQGREPVDLDATRTEVLSAQTVDHFFGHHSRSFSFAARWFPEKQRRLVACLYMFCRTVDDLVDGGAMVPDAIDSELDRWKEKAREAFDGGTSGVSWLDEVMHASADSGLPFHIVEDLIAGVRSDNGSVRIRTWEELDEYTYRVASVVGIWMCHLFGVRDPALLDRAADMG